MNNQESLPQGSIIVDRLQGGPSVFVQRRSPRGTTYNKGGDQPCIHRWSYGDHQCIDADGPPDHACVRTWSPWTTFEWDQILHDRPTNILYASTKTRDVCRLIRFDSIARTKLIPCFDSIARSKLIPCFDSITKSKLIHCFDSIARSKLIPCLTVLPGLN